jgi:hypothetical protein
MDARIAYALFNGLEGDRFTFIHAGDLHDSHTARLIELGEAAMEGVAAPRAARQRLAYVMVEAYQNIIRHRAPLAPDLARGNGRSIFMVRCHEGAQQVVAVNPLHRAELPELERSLKDIAGLDAQGLKERFLRRLGTEGHRARGGAGLGLIEMARRSGQDLRHDVRDLGPEHVLFLLQARFGDHPEIDRGMAMTAVLSGTIIQQDIVMLFKGPRTATVEEPLLALAATGDGVDAEAGRRGTLAAFALLDELAGKGGPCLVVFAREGERLEVTVGAVCPPEVQARLDDLVRSVNAMDEQARRSAYRDQLLGRSGAADPLLLAVVELARCAHRNLVMGAYPMREGSFVAVSAVV